MKTSRLSATLLLWGSLLTHRAYSQVPGPPLDYTWHPADSLVSTTFFVYSSPVTRLSNFYLKHSPDAMDARRYRQYRALISQPPTQKNHAAYSNLAGSLWELGKVAAAEKMFLTVLTSKKKFYTATQYHSSGTTYGYGSFTSSHKNNAAIYLTKINLERKKFAAALYFLNQAVKKYQVSYSCGTGMRQQQEKYTLLYAACYAGLHQPQKVLDSLLPGCLEAPDELLLQTIRKGYSPLAVQRELLAAPATIRCVLDTFPSVSYTETYRGGSTELVVTDSSTYYAGSATIELFGRRITMPNPVLENGEHASREKFVTLFKESDFYAKLTSGSQLR